MTQAVIATTVTGLQARPIATTAPTSGQALTWNGSAWAPAGPFLSTTGGTLTGPINSTFAGPYNEYTDTSVGNTVGGLWRTYVNGGYFYIQCNTAAAGNFSTATLPFYGDHSGNAWITANLNVGGGVTISGQASSAGFNTAGNVTAGNLVGTNTYPAGGVAGSVINPVNNVGWSWVCGGTNPNLFSFVCQGAVDPVFVWSHPSVTNLMTLTSVGNLNISGTLAQGSDETLKTNINPLAQGISLIRQLIPKSFAWKTSPTETNWGFVAQDVQSVIPVAVDSAYPLEPGGATTLSLDITAILAAVTYALKQVDQRLSAVEAHDGIVPPAAQLA